jgi:propanediol dehydratase small subunit
MRSSDGSAECGRFRREDAKMTEPPFTYPLIDQPELLRAASGRRLDDVTLAVAAAGELAIEDLQVRAETLRAQAAIARDAGYRQLAENLARAAELTAVPNDEVLRMYDVLRPGRATHEELLALAARLESVHDAPLCAALVREAASVYHRRGLARR